MKKPSNSTTSSTSLTLKIIYLLIVLGVIYFAFIPVLSVILSSILSGGEPISVADIKNAVFYLKNSLFVSIPVTLLATMFGLIMAFTLQRLKFKGRSTLKVLALLPLINPPFIGSIAFIMLLGRRGLITHSLLGLSISPFGPHGVITLQILGLTSLAYILVSSSIKRIDISLEEAARNLGLSETKVLATVTLPLMIPEITGTALLVFLASMADFGTPLIIGGSFQTLASQLYIEITGLYNLEKAVVLGLFLLVPCLLAFLAQRYYLKSKSFFSAGIVSEVVEFKNLNPYVKACFIGITLVFLGLISLKYGFILLGAFTQQWGHNFSFTFKHLKTVLQYEIEPFVNSVKLATIVSFTSSFLGVLLAYIIYRKKPKGATCVDFMATLPAAVPGILFGIAYLVTFRYPLFGIGRWVLVDRTPLILLGSTIIVFIICIARYLNVGLRSGYALLAHMDPSLEEASFNLGVGETKTFLHIGLPLLKPAFLAAFFKNLSTTMTTLGAIIFLLIPRNKVAVQQLFQIITSSNIGVAAAMASLLSITSLMFLGLFYMLFNSGQVIKTFKGVTKQWD